MWDLNRSKTIQTYLWAAIKTVKEYQNNPDTKQQLMVSVRAI